MLSTRVFGGIHIRGITYSQCNPCSIKSQLVEVSPGAFMLQCIFSPWQPIVKNPKPKQWDIRNGEVGGKWKRKTWWWKTDKNIWNKEERHMIAKWMVWKIKSSESSNHWEQSADSDMWVGRQASGLVGTAALWHVTPVFVTTSSPFKVMLKSQGVRERKWGLLMKSTSPTLTPSFV